MRRAPQLRLSIVFAQLLALLAPAVWAGAAPPPPTSVLPFIEDDFAEARRLALASNRLLVVDGWAPWCHTCLSMRNFVFTNPLLASMAQRFVYLAIDTEQPGNSDFVTHFPMQSWPTLFVLNVHEDGSDKVVARFTGAMSAAELLARLRELSTPAIAAGKDGPLSEADAAAVEGKWAAAAVLYARAAAEPELRSRARLGQIQALRGLGAYQSCAELGDTIYSELGWGAAAADFFSYAADCLEKVKDVDVQQRLRQRLRQHLEALIRDPRATLLPDDRSDGFGTLIELADALADTAAGDRYAEDRLQLLEAAAKSAGNPFAAATYDAHRFECYRRLKRYAAAEAMLLASEKVLIGDYNPPARLARLYFETGRLDEAMVRIDRALELAKGPRRVSMLDLKASIQHGLGQTRAAIGSLETAIAILQPTSTVSSTAATMSRVASLRKNIDALKLTLAPMNAPNDPPPAPRRRSAKVARRDTIP